MYNQTQVSFPAKDKEYSCSEKTNHQSKTDEEKGSKMRM